MEYYSAIKKNEVLIHITIRMNLENTLLSERSQITKGHILCDSLYMKCPDESNPEKHKIDK